jgi:hypothetical protein
MLSLVALMPLLDLFLGQEKIFVKRARPVSPYEIKAAFASILLSQAQPLFSRHNFVFATHGPALLYRVHAVLNKAVNTLFFEQVQK